MQHPTDGWPAWRASGEILARRGSGNGTTGRRAYSGAPQSKESRCTLCSRRPRQWCICKRPTFMRHPDAKVQRAPSHGITEDLLMKNTTNESPQMFLPATVFQRYGSPSWEMMVTSGRLSRMQPCP